MVRNYLDNEPAYEPGDGGYTDYIGGGYSSDLPTSGVVHDYTLTGNGTGSDPLSVPPYLYFGVVAAPSYTDNGNGTVTIGSDGTYSLSSVASGAVIPNQYTIAGGVKTPTDGVLSYLVADYNGGTPSLYITADVTIINETTIIPVMTFFRDGTHIHMLDWDTLGIALPNKLHQSIVKTQRFRRQNGLLLGEDPGRVITVTAGTIWQGAVPVVMGAFDQSLDTTDLYYHVAGVWTKAAITQYNNTQYDDGANLVALGPSRYGVSFVYELVSSTERHCVVVLGTGDYKLIEAQAAQPPSDLPPEINAVCVLVGRIIVLNGDAAATEINSAFTTQFTPSSVTVHNELTGLQGGSTAERYHLTSAQHAIATQAATAALAGYVTAAAQTLGGVKTFQDEPLFSSGIVLPKTSGEGIRVDVATPTYPFVDFLGNMIPDPGGANSPVLTAISGGNCRCWAYTTSDRMDVHVHLPHDYVPGSDLYVHAHWLHNGTGISGNWTATVNHQYGKGHAQGVLTAQKTVTLTYATVNIATTPQYQHRIEEVQLSTTGGSATLLDSSVLEPDGIIFLHFTLTALPTVTGGATTRVFVPYIDIHAQSTGIGTKQKAPNFYV